VCRRGHNQRRYEAESAGEGATGCRELTRGACVRTVGFEGVTTVKGAAAMTGEPSGLRRFVPMTVEGPSLRYLSALGRYTTPFSSNKCHFSTFLLSSSPCSPLCVLYRFLPSKPGYVDHWPEEMQANETSTE